VNFNKRYYFKNIANETLDIIDKGYYINKDREKVELRELIDNAVKGTKLICGSTNEEFSSCEDNINDIVNEKKDNYYVSNYSKTNVNTTNHTISVVNNTTIDTIIELRKKDIGGNIIALNFASAKSPGGGFQTGANAQEESIARASALYPCLIRCKEFYEYHKKQESPLYSNNMIYSPNVPIFRDDKGNLLSNPILCSFITSPAVNAKVARDRGIKEDVIRETMKVRIKEILNLALNKQPKAIVLGAFGCGVFGNIPKDVARIFVLELMQKIDRLKNIEVIFAIYDNNGEIINIFSEELKILIGEVKC
jgi:uncharacterized protein (TIGR02452 family)